MKTKLIILIWLLAICLANWTIVWWGPESSVLTAFALIGLTLTTRDVLHEVWHGRHLRLKMFLLITCGGILSWITQPDSGRIVIASVLAFAFSEIIDAVVYEKMFARPRLQKVNGSNAVSAAVDSLLFPTIAFGSFMPWIVVGQFVAKTLGGAIWGWLIWGRR